MRLPMILLPLTFAATPMVARAQEAAHAATRTIPSADLATVAARGAQLYAFDQAAWHTTDAMLAAKLPRETLATIRGWVVEPHGDVLSVTYYGLAGDKPFAVYSADFAHDAVSNGRAAATTERDLSPLGQRMVAAHAIAFGQPFPACTPRPFNSVILPPDARGVLPVYLLTPMVEDGAYSFGGHHEVDVAADGSIVGTRDFTRACLSIRNPSSKSSGGTRTAGLFVSHLLDPHPTEIHVYLSLWSHMPVFVGAGRRTWEVAGTRIRTVEPPK